MKVKSFWTHQLPFARVCSGVVDDELKSEARGMGPAALLVPFDG
jgi:hypothetical protein